METQMQTMSLGDETGDYSSIYNNGSNNYQSVDSKKFDNKLRIENLEEEDTYAEIKTENAYYNELPADKIKKQLEMTNSADSGVVLPVYASVNMEKKSAARREKSMSVNGDNVLMNNLDQGNAKIYEDMDGEKISNDESNIYEMVSTNTGPAVVYNEVKDKLTDEDFIYAEI